MTTLALGLVLFSALIHASWNLLAKRVAGGAEFVWLISVIDVVGYAPFALLYVLIAKPAFSAQHLWLAFVSGALHLAYFVTLQRGYRLGDLSLVYPLARGTGPALATVLAIVVLGERPGLQALVGTAFVVLSVLVLTSGRAPSGTGGKRPAILYGLLTGVFISLYTAWDGFAVGRAAAVPILYMVAVDVWRSLLLTPVVTTGRGWAEVTRLWRDHKWATIGVGMLSPLAYILVLTALSFTPVSFVAPTREISILVGTLMGARLLSEGQAGRRLVGASGMVVGVVLLALG